MTPLLLRVKLPLKTTDRFSIRPLLMPRQTCWEKYCWRRRGWWGASWSWRPCAAAAGNRWRGCRVGEHTPTRPRPWWTQSGFSSSCFRREENKCNPARWSSISFYITIPAWSSEPTDSSNKIEVNLREGRGRLLKLVSRCPPSAVIYCALTGALVRPPQTKQCQVWTREQEKDKQTCIT